MYILYWILGINLIMVVVGLLGRYVIDELIANPHLRRVYGKAQEEPQSVYGYLQFMVLGSVSKLDMAFSFLFGPYVLFETYHDAQIVRMIWGQKDPLKFLEDAVDDYLDDTQELPLGTVS